MERTTRHDVTRETHGSELVGNVIAEAVVVVVVAATHKYCLSNQAFTRVLTRKLGRTST